MRIERFSDNPKFPGISGWVIVRGRTKRQYYTIVNDIIGWVKDVGNARLFRFEDDAQDVIDSFGYTNP